MRSKTVENCCCCIFLKRSLDALNCPVYLCSKWKLKCYRVFPYKTVADAIGMNCPFFQLHEIAPVEQKDKSSGFDVVV